MRIFIILSMVIAIGSLAPVNAKDFKRAEDIINIILNEKGPPPARHDIRKTIAKPGEAGDSKDNEKRKSSVSKPSASDPAYVLLKNGIAYYNNAMFDNALAQFSQITKDYPQSPVVDQANIWKAKTLIRQYKYSEAVSVLETLPKESGEYPTALFYSAESYSHSGNHLRAIELYQQVASLFPTDPQADNALLRAGLLYLNDNKGRNALETAISLIKYYSDRETIDDAYYLLGKVFERDETLKDLEISRKIYQIFLKKAKSGVPHFDTSPLTQRVQKDLNHIEKNYLFISD